MQITRKSIITDVVRTRELPITGEQYIRWQGGELLHIVAPELSDEDREFVMTGIVPEELEY